MEASQKAIFLWKIRFRESSFMVKFLTEKGALETFVFQGTKGIKKGQLAQLFPLNEVEIETYKAPKSSLASIRNVKTLKMRSNIRGKMEQTAVAFFLAEIISKSLKENDAQPAMFEFVSSSIDLFEERYQPNFYLVFLLKLTRYLGIQPANNFQNNRSSFFDLSEGQFTILRPVHLNYLEVGDSKLLRSLIDDGYDFQLKLSKQQRNDLRDAIVKYYSMHLEGVSGLKSLSVLQELFD
ncbi:MAG: DNA repair protein RecO (recombination protein O) [Sphingobacteriales bacterium]|jgi:DNA repair protein RecO (recombination protein O)